jgi:hypothetical protein
MVEKYLINRIIHYNKMEPQNLPTNKNGEGSVENDEDFKKGFMKEEEIQEALQDEIKKNLNMLRETLAGRSIKIGGRQTTYKGYKSDDDLPSQKSKEEIDDDLLSQKSEKDILSWIEPDHKSDDPNTRTDHGKHEKKHEYTYPHMDSLDDGGYYTCDRLTDEWYKWYLTLPAAISGYTNPSRSYEDNTSFGGRSVFLFQDNNRFFKNIEPNEPKTPVSVYFVLASPFQDQDFINVTMVKRGALLVPAYNMCTSTEVYPSLDTEDKLTNLAIKDLSGIIELKAWFDRIPIEGCCVIRKQRLPITNVPLDNVNRIPQEKILDSSNSIKTCHGGYWLLIRESVLTAGEHLLQISATSRNYELNAKILINVLA